MKIVLLVSSMHAGGAERVAATLVNAWAARGDTVTLVPTYSSRGNCFYAVSEAVNLVWLADRAGPQRSRLLGAAKRLLALRRIIGEAAPDVVVSFLTNVNIAAILATRGLPAPLIVCERTNPVVKHTCSPWLRRLRRWFYPRADMVTVQAEATVEPFAREVPGIRRLAVIPNPLPPELALAPLADARGAPDGGRRRLVAMGRLVQDKQFDMLLDAYAGLAADFPDWDLWIWGEGPDRAELQARVLRHGLAERVRLPGRTETPWQELTAAQAFVLSSAVEGFPNVLLEAMALGLPCAAFDCRSGPREITRDGSDALLVPAGDRVALQAALRRLMSDAALRAELGAQAAQSVRRRYALPAVLAEWDGLFDTVRRRK